ncbi:lipoate--protein ligase [Aminivibrio sp.]|jgi:lipoate-protein ligase A|uniref:lipoate--protein ligase n=1 Tax=Aminivibrio sp. TaxID=1872489 RepID=UPI001A4387E6|nr:lipoate--protein ligase [Aminivibrio sp.]MBL3539925.1 lipoate--protein ligase [Aminivibrio sp.]
MYYIEGQSHDPAFNLAMEEHLYRTVDGGHPGYFLLWQNEPSIIVGRFQNTAQEVNRAFVEERGIRVVRRISGGGAVYHDLGNLNYTFIVPNDEGAPFDFARHAMPVVRALEKLGVKAEFNSRNDLAIDGRKFSGSAQHMDKWRLLHHGTLLFDSDLSVLGQALAVDEEKFTSKGFKSVRSRVTNILPHLPAKLSMAEFIAALRDSLSGTEQRSLTPGEVGAIEKLRATKYATWEWNWGESPEYTERKVRRFPWGKVEALLNVKNGVIVEARFFGDFFGVENRDELEAVLAGCPFRKEGLEERLSSVQLDRFFRGADPEEFLPFLLG